MPLDGLPGPALAHTPDRSRVTVLERAVGLPDNASCALIMSATRSCSSLRSRIISSDAGVPGSRGASCADRYPPTVAVNRRVRVTEHITSTLASQRMFECCSQSGLPETASCHDTARGLGSCSACALTVMCCLGRIYTRARERLHSNPNRLFRNGGLWPRLHVSS
jgi:hypothetical protein